MPDDSAAKTLDESTEEEKRKSASSSESIEEEDDNDFESEDSDEEDDSAAKPQEPESLDESKEQEKKPKPVSSSSPGEEEDSDSSDSDSDYSDDEDEDDEGVGGGGGGEGGEGEGGRKVNKKDLSKNSPEDNVRMLTEAVEKAKVVDRKLENEMVFQRDVYDFPKDPEGWREEDLRELWADAPAEMTKPGWDSAWADDEDWEIAEKEEEEGNDPPIAPFYLPYRRYYPLVPTDNIEIANPKSVIEELDRIEEFLKWVSYIFPDGSS